jgi:alkylation response protein AidB-like acyl-CoA dehydrogenase
MSAATQSGLSDDEFVGLSDDEFEEYMTKATELSQLFREVGPRHDVDNTLAAETVQPFKDSGLAGVIVPKSYGGPGANVAQLSRIIAELSKGDPAIALGYNMHWCMVGLTMSLVTEEQGNRWLRRIAEGGELIFGPSSEKAGYSALPNTKAVPQPEGGWRLYGKKTWGTLAEAASLIATNATITDADGNMPEDFDERVAADALFIADFEVDEHLQGDGVRIERTWDALGMHATGTQTVVYDGFYIPESGYVAPWRASVFGGVEWFSLTIASIYLGLQDRVLEETIAHLAKKRLGPSFGSVVGQATKVADLGYITDGIGEMATRFELSRRVVLKTCEDLVGCADGWPADLRMPYIGLAKVFVCENVLWMTRQAMSMVGGQSFRRGSIFERLYRDAAASMFQPLNADQSRNYIGQLLLAAGGSNV